MLRRSKEVALVIDPTKPYDRRIVRGVAAYVQSKACDWSLYIEEDPVYRLPDLNAWAGDGIIANFDNRRVAHAVQKAGLPVVGIGGGYGYHQKDSHIPYVRTDNIAIAELAADHLMGLGLREFAYYSPLANRTNGWAKERRIAFKKHLSRSGFRCQTFTAHYTASRHWRELLSELRNWLKQLPQKVGVMAASDTNAMYLLRACRDLERKAPEELAVVGVDNDDVLCELSRPKLTSIEQGAHKIGYQAAAILHSLMHGKGGLALDKRKRQQLSQNIPPERLIQRESTQTLAIEDEDVAAALEFIRDHACNSITVTDVLKRAHLSRSTLESRFRSFLGRTIHAEIRRVQMDKAKTLLKTTAMPIKEVARQVGASSVQYFTAMVRQATGQTPGQLRNGRAE